jgi:hypothetical protein
VGSDTPVDPVAMPLGAPGRLAVYLTVTGLDHATVARLLAEVADGLASGRRHGDLTARREGDHDGWPRRVGWWQCPPAGSG